jgi:membrane protease YdiL (CAAX protease family)
MKMKNSERIIYGTLLTIIVFILATLASRIIKLNIDFLPYSFVTHTTMLILSIALICGLKKHVNYKIALPKFKKTLKPILFGFLAAAIINPIMAVLTKILGGEVESHFAFNVMSPLQVFLFIFIYASVAEEVLFRGFFQNILKPMKNNGIKLFKRHISVPVMIGAVAFSLAHLILIMSGANIFFVVRTLIFTFVLGLIAGYYQEKYENNAYAIIVHMGGNFMGLLSALITNLAL